MKEILDQKESFSAIIKNKSHFPSILRTTGRQFSACLVIKAIATKTVALAYMDNFWFKV